MKIDYKLEIKEKDKLTPENLIKIILKQRKIKDIKEFLNPKSPLDISIFDFDKKYKNEFKKVIKILKDIKIKNQMIVVYTDYDADGITGGAILWETLYLLGFKIMPYVPDRIKEGYGFSIKGIDNVIKEYNPALIISVDHGITKIKEAEYAKKKNIKVIITDHHLKGDKLPKADAIFHIPALSGSGVSYFFSKETKNYFNNKNNKLNNNFETDYMALSSIGTIADLVPLINQSRSLVKHGLKIFPKVKRYGIKKILKQAGIDNKPITPYEVGFMIAPRINAIGRLEHAIDALRLLCTTNEKKANNLARKIGDINVTRQEMVEKSVKKAKEIVNKSKENNNLNKIIVLVSDSWHEGIIGLIASRITEEYYRPTIILTKTDGHYKGSARSIPSFNITAFLKSLKKYLVDVGGHPGAAGFTIEDKMLDSFEREVKKQGNKIINDKDLERVISTDIKIPIYKITIQMVKEIEKIEPFGIGNPKPTFYSEGSLTDAKLFGKTNNHLKITVDNLELIAFNKGELFNKLEKNQTIKIIYTLEIDRWNNRERLRGRILTLL